MMNQDLPHIVILGGGFGGLYTAKALARTPVRITLVDRRNHHLFQPLLYQVAMAGLSAVEIAQPIRKILRRQHNVTVLMAAAERVEPSQCRVVLNDGRELSYDYLVVATGATHSYFGQNHWEQHAPGLKTLEDALEIRRRVLLAYERAENEQDATARRAHLTFVVIGAGPTGAELAGALSEIARHTLVQDFRNFDPQEARILLLEGAERVLPPYPPELSRKAQQQLEKLGVEVHTGTRVSGIDDGGVWVGEERIEASTVLWAAGVAASPLGQSLGAPMDRAGRVFVEPDLSVPGHSQSFVIGDLAAVVQTSEKGDTTVPGVAPAAIQMGLHTAKNIRRRIANKQSLPFRYRDKGSMATLGRKAAVAEIGKLKLSGLPAWLAWLLIHIFFLIGFRNRFVVLFEWAWAYLTYQRSARVILQEIPPSSSEAASEPNHQEELRT